MIIYRSVEFMSFLAPVAFVFASGGAVSGNVAEVERLKEELQLKK